MMGSDPASPVGTVKLLTTEVQVEETAQSQGLDLQDEAVQDYGEVAMEVEQAQSDRDADTTDAGHHSKSPTPTVHDEKLKPSYYLPNSDIQERRLSDDNDAPSTSEIDSVQMQKKLKFDAKAWALSQTRDFGALDFVALKTYEFLHCQQKLKDLDHNSLASDRKRVVDEKADLIMKDIALSARKKYKTGSVGES